VRPILREVKEEKLVNLLCVFGFHLWRGCKCIRIGCRQARDLGHDFEEIEGWSYKDTCRDCMGSGKEHEELDMSGHEDGPQAILYETGNPCPSCGGTGQKQHEVPRKLRCKTCGKDVAVANESSVSDA